MQPLSVQGVEVPPFVYGTAWKELETARLTGLALEAGFRAIDTACQRKHYHEAGVGEALERAFSAGVLSRDDLFLQTKFTHQGGQDHRLPYDPQAPFATQVAQSFQRSLEQLRVSHLDSYVLHGPQSSRGIGAADREVWAAMESLHAEGRTRLLGVSNVSLAQLRELCALAEVQPAFVQNRCYARKGWDREVRALCRERGIVYQGFSLLTANREETAHPDLRAIAARMSLTPAQLVFRFARQVGMLPLTGTSSPEHMRLDLAALEAPPLSAADLARVEAISG
ncbi:MAG: aldo/keto reductase [Planctomycetes bacterium]|nr:aldo/keto reductase [Planctomycetota bacterium]